MTISTLVSTVVKDGSRIVETLSYLEGKEPEAYICFGAIAIHSYDPSKFDLTTLDARKVFQFSEVFGKIWDDMPTSPVIFLYLRELIVGQFSIAHPKAHSKYINSEAGAFVS